MKITQMDAYSHEMRQLISVVYLMSHVSADLLATVVTSVTGTGVSSITGTGVSKHYSWRSI